MRAARSAAWRVGEGDACRGLAPASSALGDPALFSIAQGFNEHGELGIGNTAHSTVPAAIDPSHKFVELSAGGDHTCGRKADKSVWCWGLNDKLQLGVSDIPSSLVPVAVPGASNFTSIDAGGSHTCGLVDGPDLGYGNYVRCWGVSQCCLPAASLPPSGLLEWSLRAATRNTPPSC